MLPDSIFENTEVAFAVKSNAEIERAYYLFKMIKNEPMVKIGSKITKFALNMHLPIEGIIKTTVFNHFCGGVSIDECIPTAEKMYTKKVCSIFDYSAEGKQEEEAFDKAVDITLEVIDKAKDRVYMPFTVFKPTGIGREKLYEKVSAGEALTDEEIKEWERIIARYEKVAQASVKHDVRLLIDAEDFAIQKAADDVAEMLMEKYNKDKALIYSTLQMYRNDRLDYLKSLYERSRDKGFHIGMKLVRGAYMEKERERAEKMGYPDPICKTKADTDQMYNDAVKFMFDHIDTMAIYLGTHNEKSTLMLINMIEQSGLNKNDHRFWFGQLYGMSDHITYNLSNQGYNATKYLPFGPVRDVMPYLIRRADENTSVGNQTNRELDLLAKERKRRKL
ncbi:MAG: proline dehydrogenase [Flavobacteriia bacterium]|nr:MAG: proline dehydrogenase [Flavobacteriia bacterium]